MGVERKKWSLKEHPGVQRIREARRITLSTHMGADADGLGSALALRQALEHLGVEARVILPDPLFRRVAFLDWNHEIWVYGRDASASEWLETSDLVVILDTLSLGSRSTLSQALKAAKTPVIAIDHHLGTSGTEDILFSDAAATGEIVYHLTEELGVTRTPQMASWIFASISSDTCSFRFVRGRAETFRMAGTLVDEGADPWKVQEGLYQSSSRDAITLLSRAFERMERHAKGRVIVVWFDAGSLDDLHLDRDDHRDLIQILISQAGVLAALTVTGQGEEVFKLSFRGRKGVNLEPIARKFGGGGHAQACGATLHLNPETLRERLLDVFQKEENFSDL